MVLVLECLSLSDLWRTIMYIGFSTHCQLILNWKLIKCNIEKCIIGSFYYRVIRFVPITDEDSVISCRVSKWNWNSRTAKDSDASESTSRFVKGKGWEVIEASNLVFHLQYVCVVASWWNWTRGSVHSINIRIPPVLYSVPDHPFFNY